MRSYVVRRSAAICRTFGAKLAQRAVISRSLLKNSLSPRLLKKVQMQGGITYPHGWVPGAE